MQTECERNSALLERLGDRRAHPVAELATVLEVTEEECRLQLESLQAAGARLSVDAGLWQLSDCTGLLERQALLDAVAGLADPADRRNLPHVFVDRCVASTNDRVRSAPTPLAGEFQVSIAEMQLAGRGRHGRVWQSGCCQNLMMSMRAVLKIDARWVSRLSLLVALVLAHALRECGVEACGVKWPNDVYVQGRKLAGILLESVPLASGQWEVIAGIGVNVDTRMLRIDQASIDLRATTIDTSWLDRNRLGGLFIGRLAKMLVEFEQDHGDAWLAEWPGFDLLHGREVCIHPAANGAESSWCGRAVGIGESGELLVDTEDSKAERVRRSVFAGDVRVRAQ